MDKFATSETLRTRITINHTISETLRTRITINFLMDKFATLHLRIKTYMNLL